MLSLSAALETAAAHGFRPDDAVDGVPAAYGAMLDLPLLYIHGRADSTVSYMGANLYPEDVAAGIEDAQTDGLVLGAFCLELTGEVDAVPQIHVEIVDVPSTLDHSAMVRRIEDAVRNRLALNSADYRAALLEDPRAAQLAVVAHQPGTGPFAENSQRIKRRYVLQTAAKSDAVDAHLPILTEGLRAPSAHNAQPWRLVPVTGPEEEGRRAQGTGTYELHYDHHDYLPFDPDDRDAYLCMGAFVETLSLAALRHGHVLTVAPVYVRTDSDLHVVDVTISPATGGARSRRAGAGPHGGRPAHQPLHLHPRGRCQRSCARRSRRSAARSSSRLGCPAWWRGPACSPGPTGVLSVTCSGSATVRRPRRSA